jgi:16S rRNA (cytidine1402-2'-O)-methyltransferase
MPLLICATPIGNLEDVTLRVLEALRRADAVLCEDTRRTKILLDRYGIRAEGLTAVHRHNERRQIQELVPRLLAGETLALVSDAGLPAVNDPGGRVLSAALEAGVEVTVLPGASAVETALVSSGLAATQYRFLGYLPRRGTELDALWEESRGWPYAAVAFESPRRLPTSLAALARIDPERRVAVCRELTKRFEEVVRGTAAELAARFGAAPKGEITLVLGEPVERPRSVEDDVEAVAAVRELVAAGASRGAAAEVVGRLSRIPRNELYRRSLAASD